MERAVLFGDGERLFFEMTAQGLELLSDEQIAQVETIYHEEKDDGLRALSAALDNAVGPHFAFRAAGVTS